MMCKKIQFRCQNLKIPHDVSTTGLTLQAKNDPKFLDSITSMLTTSKLTWVDFKRPKHSGKVISFSRNQIIDSPKFQHK